MKLKPANVLSIFWQSWWVTTAFWEGAGAWKDVFLREEKEEGDKNEAKWIAQQPDTQQTPQICSNKGYISKIQKQLPRTKINLCVPARWIHSTAFWWMSFDFLEVVIPFLLPCSDFSQSDVLQVYSHAFQFFQQKSLHLYILFWLKSDENPRGSQPRSTTGFVMWKTSWPETADHEQLLTIPTKAGSWAGAAEQPGKAWGACQSPRQVPQAAQPHKSLHLFL